MRVRLMILFLTLFVTYTNADWMQTMPYSARVDCLLASGTNLFAGTNGGGIFLSTDNGATWTEVNTDLTSTAIRALATFGTDLFTGTFNGGVFLSTNNGTSWTEVNTGLTYPKVYALAVSGINLFAGTCGGGVFLSTNNGTSWTAVNSGLTNMHVSALAINGTSLYTGTYGGGVFLSTNNGTSWTAVNSGLTNMNVYALAVSGMNLFASTWGGGVFLSTNNGTSWTGVNSGLTSTNVISLVVSGTNLFAGTSGGGIFLSTNNGTSWADVNSGLTYLNIYAFTVSGMTLFAGTGGGGIWRRPLSEMVGATITVTSPNGGEKWVATGERPITAHATGDITAVQFEYSTDDGSTWHYITSYSTNDPNINTLWTPRTPAKYCRVKVIVTTAGGNVFDISDGSFSVGSAPVIFIPGIMGSPLYYDINDDDHLVDDEFLWLRSMLLFLPGNPTLDPLQLQSDGETSQYNIKVAPIYNDGLKIETLLENKEEPLCRYNDFLTKLYSPTTNEKYVLDNYDSNPDEGENLFCFTYDWRKSIEINAIGLSNYIAYVKQSTKCEKVNVVAHSMGGLIAKKYIVDNGKSNINKLIFIGTPHLGAPKIHYVFLTGELKNKFFNYHINTNTGEIKKIIRNMPSVYQLFPSEEYYNSTMNNGYSLYSSRYNYSLLGPFWKPKDYYGTLDYFRSAEGVNLNLLNNAISLQQTLVNVNLSGIEVYNIVGTGTPTIGLVHTFLFFDCSYNLNGDGTVPVRSAETINNTCRANYYVEGVEHDELPSSIPVRTIVAGLLEEPAQTDFCYLNSVSCNPPPSYAISGNEIKADCPVILSALDSQGRHTGPTSDTTWEANIPGSAYTPVDLLDPTSRKTIFLPVDGEYTIRIESQDTSASFSLSIDKIVDGDMIASVRYDSVAIQPNTIATCTLATIYPSLPLSVDLDGNGTTDTTITASEYSGQSQISITAGWNLVSVPLLQTDYTASVVFPGAYGSSFGYDQVLGDYVEAPILELGWGYWVYYIDATAVTISGASPDPIIIACKQGWNLIGSREIEVQVADLQLSTGSIYGSAFYYNTSLGDYAETAVIAPGQGIWIYVTEDCELTIP